MKKFICASILSLLGATGAFAAEEILTSPSDESYSGDLETQAIRQVTYRSQNVRASRVTQTWRFSLSGAIRADEIEVRGVSGSVEVHRAVVVFNNGQSRLLNSLVGIYGERGRLGVRARNATFNNVRNIREVLITVRGAGGRWSNDTFRVIMGLSGERRRDDRDDGRFDEGIRIISATYGRNVGAPRNNALDEMAAACDGRQACSFLIDFNRLGGDPAPGVPKDFIYSFSCDGQVRAANALVPAEAHLKTVRLTCGY